MDNQEHVCCICGKKFRGWGNNPWPISDDPQALCCDECNNNAVIPARIKLSYSEK